VRSVERLIRQLANARISIVHDEQRAAIKKVPAEHKLSEVPAPVRRAVNRLKKIAAEKAGLESVIERAGYRHYHLETKLYRNDVDQKRRAIDTAAESRIQRIEALRAEALVDTIGVTPEQGKGALVAFRAAILKV
jgi:ATP-dependent protease HslVU (ClpYQ) ATPase subunit